MKKPLLLSFIFLVVCASGLYGSLYISAYRQEKSRRQVMMVSAEKAIAPERNLVDKFADRIKRKADQLTRLGITGPERHRLMGQEVDAAFKETNRVRASHYESPFDEKTLPISQK